MPPNILVVDDKKSIIEILETTLAREGFDVSNRMTGADAVEAIKNEKFDLVLCDIRLPDIDGAEILKTARALVPPLSVIMITAYGSIENAIHCMKLGAEDYVTKPFNLDELKEIVRKALDKVRLLRENVALREEIEKKYGFANIIGKSKQMSEIFSLLKRIAPTDVTVLISGETGTGKELLARAIHYHGKRAPDPFVALNCAALPENLIESELFGHVKGAFTGAYTSKRGLFEEANGGTLFLDEIGELQQSLQAKLLRTLDTATIRRVGDTRLIPVDVRLLSSTNRNLEEAVEKNSFRLDLYHRIRVVEIKIPPLRERPEDIPPLVDFYLKRLAKEHKRSASRLSTGALAALLNHHWPGNVRELINVLEQAILLSESATLNDNEILPLLRPGASSKIPFHLENKTLKDVTSSLETQVIEHTLKLTGGNRKEAARKLGISERTLYYKLEEYNIR
ncbi:MAG: sigma-54 dependent transcriptional regulator [bacterium]